MTDTLREQVAPDSGRKLTAAVATEIHNEAMGTRTWEDRMAAADRIIKLVREADAREEQEVVLKKAIVKHLCHECPANALYVSHGGGDVTAWWESAIARIREECVEGE